jgi:hypothetical protein
MKGKESIDVCITFDTTGSMYPCLTQVRRNVAQTVKRLFKDIGGLRVAIIAHGDYCDKHRTYVTKTLNFTSDEKKICDFVRDVEPTFGGDAPECYELVLRIARTKLDWKSGRSKVVVMIGDDVPHGPSYPENTEKIDWRNELGLLKEAGISVYGVHAMPGCRRHSKSFYEEVGKKTSGFYLTLDQFAAINSLIMACCYKQQSDADVENYAKELTKAKMMNRNVSMIFATLLGRTVTAARTASGLTPVPPGRFQVLDVDQKTPIMEFVKDQGASFKKGRGFYQLTKAETVQGYKEIVLMDKDTGDIFNGDEVRTLLDMPPHSGKNDDEREDVRLHAVHLAKYDVFIQSTSINRSLIAGTKLLYEVDDWDKVAEEVLV